MGNEQSDTLSQEKVQQLVNTTRFTEKEINTWFQKFRTDFPQGVITKPAFISMYSRMFPHGDAAEFSENIFRAYDIDGNGEIDFDEFLQTLSVASKGSVDEKLKWAFKMYDLDGNGYVSRDEAISIITSIFKMRGDNDKDAREKAEEAALQIFLKLDKNMDENLSEVEFILAAKNSSVIRGLLQGGT